MDGKIGSRNEYQREQDQLHHGRRSVCVAYHRGDCDPKCTEAGGGEHQSDNNGSPLVGQRDAINPANNNDQYDFCDADQYTVGEEPPK